MPFRYQQPIPAFIVADYTTKFTDPLKLHAGDKVTLGQKDPEYPGWIWCTDTNHKSGWAPVAFIKIDGDTGVMTRDYDAAELSVTVGDTVTILSEESGWYWCKTSRGEIGWLPKENVGSL
jgi:uncharacterized protein YgiM (DUF1202 family)